MTNTDDTFFVSPQGDDANPGTEAKPFRSIARARDAVRQSPVRGTRSLAVLLGAGTYYLDETLVLSAEDSGGPGAEVTYRAQDDARAIISGGRKLDLTWTSYAAGVMQAQTPDGISFDQLFLDGARQHMARYPNYLPNVLPYNGYSADAFSAERAARWSNPEGGFIHAMHRSHWGGYHYRITGKDAEGAVSYEGGWQNNRQMGMHKSYRFVENIFEELDVPGEWYHDADTQTLYCYPPEGVDLTTALVEVSGLKHLVAFRGEPSQPVHHISLSGLTFRHSARTFMETTEPLLRSDWTIYRGGGVLFDGAEDCEISNCEFDQLGGNAVFVNKYNRRIALRASHIHGAGASGVCFVGDPDSVRNPLFEYGERQAYADIDQTPGPKTDRYPSGCVVEDCLIHNVGVVEKQATGVQISMSRGITVRHCSIYDVGRAGINISEGTFGGHVVEFCDVFDTVRETGDHGSFNSWGRDRFWELEGAPEDQLSELALLDAEKTIIRNSRWRCDHGWDVDLDDGSSNYEIYENVFLRGGLKLREGFHRKVYNNIAVNSSLHAHVWYAGSRDVISNNIWMLTYPHPIRMPEGEWGDSNDRNVFQSETARDKARPNGWDANSIVCELNFVDAANGDYRLKDGSPALDLGFKNFPMDRFGVQSAHLKSIARVPVFPQLLGPDDEPVRPRHFKGHWLGANVKALSGEEFSAFGVSKEDGGIQILDLAADSPAARIGLRQGDLVQRVNGRATKSIADLNATLEDAAVTTFEVLFVRYQKAQTVSVDVGEI